MEVQKCHPWRYKGNVSSHFFQAPNVVHVALVNGCGGAEGWLSYPPRCLRTLKSVSRLLLRGKSLRGKPQAAERAAHRRGKTSATFACLFLTGKITGYDACPSVSSQRISTGRLWPYRRTSPSHVTPLPLNVRGNTARLVSIPPFLCYKRFEERARFRVRDPWSQSLPRSTQAN